MSLFINQTLKNMELKEKKGRKGSIVTIGTDKMKRIPRVFETIFKLEQTPVTDGEDVNSDETFKLHTLRTIDVEGVTRVPGKAAVSINGEFEISLEDDGEESEKDILNKAYGDKDEAIKAWAYLTELQLEKAKAMKAKIDLTVATLQTSKDENQY